MKKKRALISSNAIFSKTGYGVQAKGLAEQLVKRGYEVANFAWYGLSGGVIKLGDVTIYPRLRHNFGGDAHIIAKHFEADVLITIEDVWVLPPNFGELQPCPWIAWTPIDGEPLAPANEMRLNGCPYVVTETDWALDLCYDAGLAQSIHIPHGINEKFVPADNRAALRQELGISEDTFVVLMVAANKGFPSRKSYPEAIAAFKQFSDQNPNALLYLHTELNAPNGLDLEDVLRVAGLDKSKVKSTDQNAYAMGMDDDFVVTLYQVADVLLNPAKGEGFGLPIVEAQACGCPVITTNFSSMPELTEFGIAVPYLQKEYNPIGMYHVTVDIEEIAAALWEIKDITEINDGVRKLVSQSMHSKYGWDIVGEKWHELIQTAIGTPLRKEAEYVKA